MSAKADGVGSSSSGPKGRSQDASDVKLNGVNRVAKPGFVVPLIGISTSFDPGGLIHKSKDHLYLKLEYARAVSHVGGLPVAVPLVTKRSANAYISRLDGLVVTGGRDIDPGRYGQKAGGAHDPEISRRVASDTQLIEAALDRNVPLLAICYGMQLLNVVMGGWLHQDIPTDLPEALDHGTGDNPIRHKVFVTAGTFLRKVCRCNTATVASTHHQAVKMVGGGLVASAQAPDGVIEAVERRDAMSGYCLGVQWHPESTCRDWTKPERSGAVDKRIFESLVAAAREYSRTCQ
jgi:putative glutamine amidotransferase